MYTALEDIKIDKIDFDWISNTTKISHLKRAIKVIELDGNYYPQLKQACYKRIEQLDPTQKRIVISNSVSQQTKKQIQHELLEWEKNLEIKQHIKQNKITKQAELQDFESYFANEDKPNDKERKSKMAEAERVKGNEAIKSKDFQQAITYYTTSLSLDPQMYQSYSNRALAYLKIKQYQKCIDDCQSALKIDPNHVKAFHRKAKALIGLNKKVQAYRCLQQGQRIQPQNAELTKELKQLREQMTPDQIKQLDSHLIPKSEFKKITIEEDSDQDD